MPYHTAQYQVCIHVLMWFISLVGKTTDLYAIMIMTCLSTLDKSSFMFILLLCFDSLSLLQFLLLRMMKTTLAKKTW